MRRTSLLGLMVVLAAAASNSAAQSDSLTIARAITVDPGDLGVMEIKCPPGYTPRHVWVTPERNDVTRTRQIIDANGNTTNGGFDGAALPGGGRRVTVTNRGDRTYDGVVHLICERIAATTEVTGQATIPANSNGSVATFCPEGQTPIGATNDADGVTKVERFRVYLSGRPPTVTIMDDLPDGTHAGPTGIGEGYANPTGAPVLVHLATACAALPNAQMLISSSPTTPGAPYSVFAPVPDGFDVRGAAYVGGLYASNNTISVWGNDGFVSALLPYAFADGTVRTLRTKGIYLDGLDNRPTGKTRPKASARAVVGLLVTPSATPAPAPTIATIIEYYHASLDHYFMTAIPQEISDLDSGVHQGWARTGQTFNAYGLGSAGRTGRRPVCRAYGNPAAGLDSHFYSASSQECAATVAGFGGAWLLEASEVFEMELPDTTTGTCPAGSVPVHRFWNNRSDSNHRYVAPALRAEMTARGYIAEGYGPTAVTLCALP